MFQAVSQQSLQMYVTVFSIFYFNVIIYILTLTIIFMLIFLIDVSFLKTLNEFKGFCQVPFMSNIFILSLGMAVNQLTIVYQMHYSLDLLSARQVLLLITFAIILGWLGARLSVKRQLASIEPQL